MRYYLCIDLKTFYASVECVVRGLDPYQTDLIVADQERTKGAICLAISPKMKQRGIRNRCRVWEIPKNIHPIVAKPRMKLYIKYSARIYAIYLKYIAKEDIHPYSIDEMFLDITNYLNLYQKTPEEMAKMIINDIYKTTGITASAGIGTNLYLAKIALDIIAKHKSSNIAYLDEKSYQETLWHHRPLTDFWRVSNGIANRLQKYHLNDMYDVAHCNEKILYKELGINAQLLIDHAWGRESCTIADIKDYRPKSHSLSNGQILYRDYNYLEARIVLIEMVDNMVLQLQKKNYYTNYVGFYVGYAKHQIPSLHVSFKLEQPTASFKKILQKVLEEYDYRIQSQFAIRRLNVYFGEIALKKYTQLDLFTSPLVEDIEDKIEHVILTIKDRYGQNSLLRATSYQKSATQRERNKLIGGHNAE